MPSKPNRTVNFLVTAALQAPSADNSQPWHFNWDGSDLAVNYDADRVAGLTFPSNDPATLLSVGGVIENLTQAAAHLGLRIEPGELAATDSKAAIHVRMKLGPEEPAELPCTGRDLPLFHRHTNRLSFKHHTLPEDLTAWIPAEGELNASAAVITDPYKIRHIAKLVRSASEIRFQTREVHEWLAKSLRFNPSEVGRGDGLDVATLALPPAGGLFLKFISDWRRMAFLNRFGAFRMLSVIDAAPIGKAPALVAITSPAGAEQVVAAGRLLTRLWTRLNAEGVAVHPYYVIPDQLQRLKQKRIPEHLITRARDLEHQASRLFALHDNSTELRMLLRIGYPKKKPIRSRRLPLQAVFTDSSNKLATDPNGAQLQDKV